MSDNRSYERKKEDAKLWITNQGSDFVSCDNCGDLSFNRSERLDTPKAKYLDRGKK